MGILSRSLVTPGGLQLYPDYYNPQRYYVIPEGLDLTLDENGNFRFNLLFYQSEYPEHGARLVMELTPIFPQPDPVDVREVTVVNPQLMGVAFSTGEIQLIWPEIDNPPELIQLIADNHIHIETGMTRSQASALHKILSRNAGNVSINVRLVYVQMTESLPITAKINIRKVSYALLHSSDEKVVKGKRFRELIAKMPTEAVTLVSQGEFSEMPQSEMLRRCSPALAPLIAEATSDVDDDGLIFDEKSVRFRKIDEVEDEEIWIDLSYPRPWGSIWSGEWSLSDFRRRVEADGQLATYFPEVLHVPVIGNAQLLIENLLTLSEDTVSAVKVNLKHRRLGSLEEDQTQVLFTPKTAPVRTHTIPVIAFTPFAYQYAVQLEIAPSRRGDIPEYVPPYPLWQKSDHPLVEVGAPYLPYAQLFIGTEDSVFDYIGRADIEIAAPRDNSPQILARRTLTAEQPRQWLLIRSLPSSTRMIRWRALLYQKPDGNSEPIYRPWKSESNARALLSTWDVYPRDPIKVQVTVHKGDTPEIKVLKMQLSTGSQAGGDTEQQIEHIFTGNESRVFNLWPETIFEQGFVYRYGVVLVDENELWSVWKSGIGDTLKVNVENEFYFKRIIEVKVRAPWSEQRSPDTSIRKGEIIFVEVHLSLLQATDTQSRSFTFDRDNQGASFKWHIKGHRGDEQYRYKVEALSLDGRLHEFGPHESTKSPLVLEIYRTFVSDIAAPEFDVREVHD